MSQIKGLARTLEFLRSQSLAQQSVMADNSTLPPIRQNALFIDRFSPDYLYAIPYHYYRLT